MKKLPYFLPIVAVLFAVACIHTVSRYNVRASDRLMIPYQTGDTVYCIDAKGNRVMLTVTDETSWWDHYDEYIWEEYRTVHLKSEDSAYKLDIQVQGWNFGYNSSRPLYATFYFNSDALCGSKILYTSGMRFIGKVYDSVLIGERTYHNVAFREQSNINGLIQFYYSKTYGVLQMLLDEKPVFTLDTVIFAGAR